ncbi:hypothetical protein D9M68_631240 [compost metagenome]
MQRARNFRPHHDQGAAAVADDTAVELVERVGNHPGREHVGHAYRLAQHRVGVVPGVRGGGHLDPGKLFAGGAVLMHVACRGERVHVDGNRCVRQLERNVGRRGIDHARGAFGPGLAGKRDQCDIAFPGRDGLGRVGDVHEIG